MLRSLVGSEMCIRDRYLMHVDPGNTVLAVTMFGAVPNPVTWTKYYGKGLSLIHI